MSILGLSILSAVLLSLSFSSFNLWFLAWFGFIPLLVVLENKTLSKSFIISYICGILFWSFSVYWLIHVTLIGQIVLILYLAFYFGIFGCAVYLRRFLPSGIFLLFISCTWVLLEYVRSYLFTGFPWALVAFSQYKNLPVIQLADIFGAWWVSFLVILFNAALYLILRRQLKLKNFLICAVVLFVSFAYGFLKLNQNQGDGSQREPSPLFQKIKVSLVQGNIAQNLKWNKGAVNFIQNRYSELTSAAAKDNPDLVIWPEASVPGLWGQDEAEFKEVFSLAKQQNINLLAGAVSLLEGKYFNSALFIDRKGRLLDIYNKLHLVPFGEYIPLKNILPFLETIAPIGDIQPGKTYTIFKQPVKFGVLICFEDLFPELSRCFVKKGAGFLVNITNDAWYKETSAPFQHFAASVFRAVENRVYLVRSANTGISGFIDPFGRCLSIVRDEAGKEIFVAGHSSQNIYLAANKLTFYNRYGDFLIIFFLAFDGCVIIFVLRKKR